MNTKNEYTYFNEHDEYATLARRLEERHTYQDFNDYHFFVLDGVAYKKLNDNNKKATEMSLEELKAVNAFFDRLDNAVNMLVSESFSEFPIDK
jgi:(p)ppGpp synthase/HD superfamily hydrolase